MIKWYEVVYVIAATLLVVWLVTTLSPCSKGNTIDRRAAGKTHEICMVAPGCIYNEEDLDNYLTAIVIEKQCINGIK